MKIAGHTLSERNQVVIIIVIMTLAILGIWFFLVRPQKQQRVENEAMERRLRQNKYARMNSTALSTAVMHEDQSTQKLRKEWREVMDRLGTFANQDALRKSDVDRIDYKVELYRTRNRLVQKSDALGVQLIPTLLGMDDAVYGNEDARLLMLQLRSVEKLADLTLDRRISRIHSIKPLPLVDHKDPRGETVVEEMPVEVELDVTLENLYDLFQAVFEEHSVFVFRNIRVHAASTQGAPLRVHAVMSALIFDTTGTSS